MEHKKEKEKALDNYIKDKHTKEECIGFIDGWEAQEERIKALELELGLERIHSGHLTTLNKSQDLALGKAWEENKRLNLKVKEAYYEQNHYLDHSPDLADKGWEEFAKDNNIDL